MKKSVLSGIKLIFIIIFSILFTLSLIILPAVYTYGKLYTPSQAHQIIKSSMINSNISSEALINISKGCKDNELILLGGSQKISCEALKTGDLDYISKDIIKNSIHIFEDESSELYKANYWVNKIILRILVLVLIISLLTLILLNRKNKKSLFFTLGITFFLSAIGFVLLSIVVDSSVLAKTVLDYGPGVWPTIIYLNLSILSFLIFKYWKNKQ